MAGQEAGKGAGMHGVLNHKRRNTAGCAVRVYKIIPWVLLGVCFAMTSIVQIWITDADRKSDGTWTWQ